MLLYSGAGFCQDKYESEFKLTRILIILDASGSMNAKWEDKTMFDIARNLLVNVIDSIEKLNPDVEFGLRVFGHQSPREENNCQDTRLELPFGPKSAPRIKKRLSEIKAQGHTPIAYSMLQCIGDFPNDGFAKNALILITDGLENCGGDPCSVSQQLIKNGITLKPFIIGMGLTSEVEKSAFDCVGNYYDATTEQGFQQALDIVVSQATHNTTTQINLIKQDGTPTETNLEMTFYDGARGVIRYNIVHNMMADGTPDTLRLSPMGTYDLVVHSIPKLEKKGIELVPGRHNIIGIDVHQGTLYTGIEKGYHNKTITCVVQQSGTNKTLYVQDMNASQKYLVGEYDLIFTSVPKKVFENVKLRQNQTTEITIPNPGTLYISSQKEGIGSIYEMVEGEYRRIYDFKSISVHKKSLEMLPGKYLFVFRPRVSYDEEDTMTEEFEIKSNQVTNIRFQ